MRTLDEGVGSLDLQLSLETTVTVLLVMEPGTTGIRRGNRSADPVLCLRTGCYISAGAHMKAKWMGGARALAPINTLGRRAGACRHSLGCVFRAVDLGAHSIIQPVDLRYLRHDRREARPVAADPTCELAGGRLTCGRTQRGRGWRAWIVSERLALRAGPGELTAALATLESGFESALYRDPMER